jgi:hypothetical protein
MFGVDAGVNTGAPVRLGRFVVLAGLLCVMCCAAHPDVTVAVTAPGGNFSQTVPETGGPFSIDLPLNKNMVNTVKLTASDANGNTAEKNLSITQVSLESVVISQFTSTPLAPERVEQLVNDGVIDLKNPENYNVSEFTIVLSVGPREIPLAIPIAMPKEVDDPQGWEVYKMPQGDGSGGGGPQQQDMQIIVFDKEIPGPAGEAAISVPGVIIIEGRIKSLKEFFSCRLLLMNASGIFTLSNVTATISYPDGGLSSILPTDGIASFGDILPGDSGKPGQVEKEFVIRGDEKGVRRVNVNFGGLVKGPGIPDEKAIPFNGSASTDVEVKGPPTFQVVVTHPDEVQKNVPYELKVDITNTGEAPALYASLDLDVGGDAKLQDCATQPGSTDVTCTDIKGVVTRSLGQLYPGATVSETYTITSSVDGAITSCMGVSSENVSLQVLVGSIGCVTGHQPPIRGATAGVPTVTVLPAANATGIGIDAPVTAFFSEKINESTVTTGEGGTFNVYTKAGVRLPGQLRFATIMDKTVAIWQVLDNVTDRLAPDTEYSVVITKDIKDLDYNGLFNAWTSTFSTTGMALNDTTPPDLSLSVQPPVLANDVLPGQIVKINAYASDQGSGVVRVEARLKDLDAEDAKYQLIDQRSVLAGDTPPYIFSVDSAKLTPGHRLRLHGQRAKCDHQHRPGAQRHPAHHYVAVESCRPGVAGDFDRCHAARVDGRGPASSILSGRRHNPLRHQHALPIPGAFEHAHARVGRAHRARGRPGRPRPVRTGDARL